LDILEIVFLSRLFLKALLETRNDILARSIRDACADSNTGTVVAVLGAAHLNGVQARLLEGGDNEMFDDWETLGDKATVTSVRESFL
jgi:pheromone shutdown protein TraB